MKVWSWDLTTRDLEAAAQQVNDEFPGCQVYLGGDGPTLYEGPRTRRIDAVHLRSQTGRYYPNPGTGGDDFHAQTNGRFIEPRSPRERQIKREIERVA